MNTIDVGDLPEPFAQAVKAVAETFRRQLATTEDEKGKQQGKNPDGLPSWPLGVVGNLSRDEIHDDRD